MRWLKSWFVISNVVQHRLWWRGVVKRVKRWKGGEKAWWKGDAAPKYWWQISMTKELWVWLKSWFVMSILVQHRLFTTHHLHVRCQRLPRIKFSEVILYQIHHTYSVCFILLACVQHDNSLRVALARVLSAFVAHYKSEKTIHSTIHPIQ